MNGPITTTKAAFYPIKSSPQEKESIIKKAVDRRVRVIYNHTPCWRDFEITAQLTRECRLVCDTVKI
jgi:hypothetical protein